MQTVCQLHQQRTDVIVDGVKHLLVIIHLPRHLVVLFFLLGHYSHQKSDIITETLLYIIYRKVCIFHNVVQESSNNGVGTQHQFLCHDVGNSDRVEDIGFARLTFLVCMCRFSQFKGSANTLHVLC